MFDQAQIHEFKVLAYTAAKIILTFDRSRQDFVSLGVSISPFDAAS